MRRVAWFLVLATGVLTGGRASATPAQCLSPRISDRDTLVCAAADSGALGAELWCLHHGPAACPVVRTGSGAALAVADVTTLASISEPFLGDGFVAARLGSGSWSGDTYTPSSGTFTVTGAPSGGITLTGGGTQYISLHMNSLANGSGFSAQDATVGPRLLYSASSVATLQGLKPDGASAIALVIGHAGSAFATAGAKLISIQDGITNADGTVGTEKYAFKWDSGLVFSNTAAPAATDVGIGNDGSSDLLLNAPSGKFVDLQTNQTTSGRAEPVTAAPTTLAGQFAFAHASGGSSTPTAATAGSGCGTSSAPTISGNDFMGTIGVTCGIAGTAGNNLVTATFAHAYSTNAPVCVFTPANAATSTAFVSAKEINNSTTSTLAVECGTGGTCPTGTLLWSYVCSQQ